MRDTQHSEKSRDLRISREVPILPMLADAGMFSETFQGILKLSEFFQMASGKGRLTRFHFSPLFLSFTSFLLMLCEITLCTIPA